MAVNLPADGGDKKPVAVVCSGAGARGAYEAGALSVLLPALTDDDRPRILVGTSSGALNCALLANLFAQHVEAPGDGLVEAWSQIRPKDVFRRPLRGVLSSLAWHIHHQRGTTSALVDTAPMAATVRRLVGDYGGAVRAGAVDTIAIVASSCSTGKAVVFLETAGPVPTACNQGGVVYRPVELHVEHLLGSAAFPAAFPAVRIDCDWYVDGGIHLNTPLKPAIDFGADRILVLGGTPIGPSDPSQSQKPPDVMDGGGQVLRAVLTDRMQTDLATLSRTNQYVRAARLASGEEPASPQHRVIETCVVSPSDDRLNGVAASIWRSDWKNLWKSIWGYGVLGVATRQRQQPGQVMSYLCFDPDFIASAIAQGQEDARRKLQGGRFVPWEA
jgi:NTE family protein